MSLLRDPCGKLSMMRMGFSVSLLLGTIVTLAGAVAMFKSLPDAAIAMTVGTGLIGGSSFAKAIQSKWEGVDGTFNK